MNFPEDEAPKLSKLPFFAGDLALLAAAFIIATRSATPLGTGPLVAITACVVIGAALAVIPFLADYARRCDAELKERQDQIAALARTTAESAEQLGIVASGLNGISESSKHNLGALEKLPAQLKTRIDEITQQLAGSAIAAHSSVKEDSAALEAAAEKLARVLAKLETAAIAKTDALAAAEKDLSATLASATAAIDAFRARAAALPPPSAPAAIEPPSPEIPPSPPAPIPVAASTSEPTPPAADEITAPPFTPSDPVADEVPVAPEPEPETPKPPRARKPKPAEADIADLGLTPDAPEPSESSVTSDGFTRLVATAYIGIGNKLFVRGEGPGLSWDKGVPLQFVSIGKWRWETPDATAPVRVKLYKNDQVECQGLGTLTLDPGRQHEVNAGF